MSLRDEVPRLPDARALTELEDALSALDQAGYQVQSTKTLRGSLTALESELAAAVADLREAEREGESPRLTAAGAHMETALGYLRWRVNTPGSPVIERIIAVAGAAAGSARPLADAIMRLSDDLPAGPVDEEAEVRRAVEAAFAAVVRWLPLVAAAAGDPEAGETVRGLEHSQASYLAEFLRQQKSTFQQAAQAAVEDAADALDAAGRLGREAPIAASVGVADEAAQVLRVMVELRSPQVFDELRRFVDVAATWPLRVPLRDLS